MIHDDPYGTKRTCEQIKATCNDISASLDGCSDYERRLRKLSPLCLYRDDATFREIMIKLDVIRHRNATPWWARW